ncbi:MAG: zinc ABC transporter substrate-binding protein, partial [Planctomycetaceae bacterium]|nr:zinc ABC transporter substrate-binding protein [Planctomycetaceae bacterium]
MTCTTGMVADLARGIGGDRVAVVQLMGPGVDPHLYTATPRDVDALNEAQVIFYSGLHLEGRMTEIFERLARRKSTFAVTASIPRDRLLEVSPGTYDPHVWFDVKLWALGIETVCSALTQVDPAHAAEYAARAHELAARYRDLDAYCRAQAETIASARRVLITAHDAFHYFGRAYGFEVESIQGISTDSEASVSQINALVDFICQRQIKAVFVEHSLNERNMRALIEGCQARGHDVGIGGELYSDALGPPQSPAGDY